MLVVTANWGLGDGTLPGQVAAARAAVPAIERAVLRAGMRADGRYRPVEGVDVVLAGDTLDMLVSDEWTGGLRPWHGGSRVAAARTRVAARALDLAADALAPLLAWTRRGLPVPAADARERPDAARAVAVPVRVTLLAGDRDPWLPVTPLPRTWQGWPVAMEWTTDGAAVRHGHDLDPLCHATTEPVTAAGRPATLAESVAVDLLVPFLRRLRDADTAWRPARPLLRELAAARAPALPKLIAAWLSAADAAAARVVEAQWRQSVAAWLREARRTPPGCEAEFDGLETLAGWLDDVRHRPHTADREPLPPAAPGRDRSGAVQVLGHGSGPACAEHGVVRVVRAGPCSAADGWRSCGTDLVVRHPHGGRHHWERLAGTAWPGPVVAICGAPPHAAGGFVVDAA